MKASQVSYGGGRVISLSRSDATIIVELPTLLEAHIESQVAAEQARLLPIVRGMRLEQV